MVFPSLLAIIAPIATGLIFGVPGVIGLLIGGLSSGFVLAIFMANAGGAWDNAKKFIEEGNFQGEGMPGKMQFGSGWWFNDQKDGMERQMTQLAQLGLLSRFVGMLTDSRSFLSYTRHEYFRRILCQMIGRWVEAGEAPADINLLGEMVKNICFNNARDYFAIELN